MIRFIIGPSRTSVICDPNVVEVLSREFRFRNKAVKHEYDRVRKGWAFRDKAYGTNEVLQEKKKQQLAEIKARMDVDPVERTEGGCVIPTGLLARSLGLLEGREIELEDTREKGGVTMPVPEPTYKLRKPQREALEIIRGGGLMNCSVRIATGVGKTLLSQELIRTNPVSTILLTPSKGILAQTLKRFREFFGEEFVGVYGGGKKDPKFITVATYQSVANGSPEEFAHFRQVIGDEYHHDGADSFYDVSMNKLANAAYRYGMSADEERADGGTVLVEGAFGPVVYDYPARRAIEDGYLARPLVVVYDVLNTSGSYKLWRTKNKKRVAVGSRRSSPEDFEEPDDAYKNWVLGNDLLNKKFAEMGLGFAKEGLSVLFLVDEIEHGEKLAALMPGAELATGKGKNNEELIQRFNDRELRVLIGTSTLGEGRDLVPTDVMFNLQVGASRSSTKQSNGRALRSDPDPVTGEARKLFCIIVDVNFPGCRTLERHSKVRQEVYHELVDEIERCTLEL